jgi:hypothetical protein
MEPVNPHTKKGDGKLIPPTEITADFSPAPDSAEADGKALEVDEYLRESVKAEELYSVAVTDWEKGNERDRIARLLRAAKQAEIAHEWHLAALSFHAMADIFRGSGLERNLERAARFYRRAIAAYEECGHFDEAASLEYVVSGLRLWHARELGLSWVLRIEMFLYWATAGFGYRPLRVLGSSVVMILAFAFIYWATGGVMDADEEPITDFSSAAYFSGSTFLTINYGDLLPMRHVRWLTVVEGRFGLTMSSFFVVVLANRLRH